LSRVTFVLPTGTRVSKDSLGAIYDGVKIMHESNAFDMILDEGRIEGQILLLLRQGRKRFGPPSPKIEAALTAIKDAERLERLGDAILTSYGVKIMRDFNVLDTFLGPALCYGIIAGQLRLLRRQGRKRSGPPTPKIDAAIAAIYDADHLDRLGDAILTAKSWNELLATK
jgi:hypothetical protein